MKVKQSFTIARPVDAVWRFFQDIRAVAACMPGATLTDEIAPGTYAGKISVRLGPFGAIFEGEATVSFDQANRTGHAEGRGIDKRGGSRSKMTVDFVVADEPAGTTTVHLDADITLSGAIAQFGRTGIIQETANILIGTFVGNLEARLGSPAPAHYLSNGAGLSVMGAVHATEPAPLRTGSAGDGATGPAPMADVVAQASATDHERAAATKIDEITPVWATAGPVSSQLQAISVGRVLFLALKAWLRRLLRGTGGS